MKTSLLERKRIAGAYVNCWTLVRFDNRLKHLLMAKEGAIVLRNMYTNPTSLIMLLQMSCTLWFCCSYICVYYLLKWWHESWRSSQMVLKQSGSWDGIWVVSRKCVRTFETWKRVYISRDNQEVLKILGSYIFRSTLVWDCVIVRRVQKCYPLLGLVRVIVEMCRLKNAQRIWGYSVANPKGW